MLEQRHGAEGQPTGAATRQAKQKQQSSDELKLSASPTTDSCELAPSSKRPTTVGGDNDISSDGSQL
jgi:hypothetical protein